MKRFAAALAILMLATPAAALSPYRPLNETEPCRLGEWQNDDTAELPGCPDDVRLLVDRALGCQHWMGEEPYDNARGHEIDTAITELKCDKLSAEYHALLERYKDRADVVRALSLADREFSLEF